jgi:hypothetical protein
MIRELKVTNNLRLKYLDRFLKELGRQMYLLVLSEDKKQRNN